MKHLLKIFLLFLPILSLGQSFNYKYFTANNGLPSSYINTVFQAIDGYLWVGTYGGLSRFDGTNFKNFTVNDGLGSNQILAITQDKKQQLWLGTFFGLSIYDGSGFRNISEIDGTTIERTRTLCHDSEGNIWGGCMNGIWRFDSKTEKFKLFKKINDSTNLRGIRSIIEYKKGQILFGSGFYSYLFDGKNFKEIKTTEGLSSSSTNISKINNQFLVGTYEQGFKEFGGESFSIVPNHTEVEKTIIFQSIIDKKGRIWVATENGVYIYEKNKLFFHLNKKNHLPDNLCLDLTEDSEGNIWISTPEGVVRCRYGFIDKFDKTNGLLNDEIYSLFFDKKDKKMYFGSIGNDILAFANDQFSSHFKSISKPSMVNFIRKDLDDNFWLSFEGTGLISIEKNKITKHPLFHNYLSAFAQNPIDKTIWIGGRSELYQYDGKKWTTFGKGQLFKGDDILGLYVDQWQQLWIACKGLWMYDGKKFYDFSKQTDTENILIQALEVDKNGNLWLGGIGSGIRKVEINKKNVKLLEKINVSGGLMNESIMDLKFDNHGQLWVSSFGGVLRMDVFKQKINGKYITKIFDFNDGLIPNSWRVVPMQKDNEGNIWVGTTKGAMRFRINDMSPSKQAPKVHINQLKLFQEDFDWKKHAKTKLSLSELPDSLTLTANQNFLTFYFTGISLSNPQNIFYSYKLDGLDKNWSPLTQQNNISYSKLSPGTYTFRVKAMNSDGIWSQPKVILFEIKPAFWQTSWFRLFIAILAVVAIFVFFKAREKRINEKNQFELQMTELKLKAIQSQMNPHFLFNSLNSVQNYILTNRGIEGARYLSKFSKLVRKIMENSNHQFLRFEEIIETLKMYVEIESFRFNHEFHYEFDIEKDETLLETQLPPMLLQPYVENSIWHGLMPKEGDKRLVIRALKKDTYIFCSIEDNGVGRKNSEPRTPGHISRGQEMTKGIFDSFRQNNKQADLKIIDLFDTDNQPIGTKVEMLIPIS